MENTYGYTLIEQGDNHEDEDYIVSNNNGVKNCLKGDFQSGISDFNNALLDNSNDSVILKNRSQAYADASIIDMLQSFGFTFTRSSDQFYSKFDVFKQRLRWE